MEQQLPTGFPFTKAGGVVTAEINGVTNDPRAVLVARCVILVPVVITTASIAGTLYLTSYLLHGVSNTQPPSPVVFLYLLAYLVVLVLALRFACMGLALCLEKGRKDALAMLVGARLTAWIETSRWFAIWRTKVLGMMLLIQAVMIFVCWAWSVARLVGAAV